MNKVYDHRNYQEKIYKLWEKSGAFTPKIDKTKKPFSIIMPPPNANDPLHIGHAREIATQDTLIRFQRMRGVPTLWLPGADHAGIETQFVFERRLKEKGKSRFDYTPEKLYKMIWDYVQENRQTMENQLKQLGASCDWTRNKFTLDPKIVKLVYKTFKKLFDQGLVYRGERIVNYCPRCGTSFSELEVNHLEEKGELFYIDYGTLTIATTRPETIFADVAVAVNPKDPKNKNLIGKKAVVPLINREVEIIGDALVDPEFGTGALKITPGHDATDFEIGQRHSLPKLSVIDKRGRMTNTPNPYLGLSAKEAREKVVNDLKSAGKLRKIEKIKHLVGVCYRDKGLIEPMLSEQWFIRIKPLTQMALAAIDSGEVRFTAAKFEKIARHWLKNLRDWNISRQIVWGIRIPAWRCGQCSKWTITEGKPPLKCSSCGHKNLTQDLDTFDTWFSSSQWPFVTLKSCQRGDFEYFYPTSVMNPAYDILPFWVIRMIMLGIFATDRVPFKTVLLHGLVRDKHGIKISKSKGNIIDPIEMSNKYGSDALRMALIWGVLVENDSSLSEENIRGQRNFSNKIWNIARFVFANRTGTERANKETQKDKWIKEEAKKTVEKVSKGLEKYKLSQAAKEVYRFIWHKFADIYIEDFKRGNCSYGVLVQTLITSLKILHPFMPFVTEAIWSFGRDQDKKTFDSPLLITSSWPKY